MHSWRALLNNREVQQVEEGLKEESRELFKMDDVTTRAVFLWLIY